MTIAAFKLADSVTDLRVSEEEEQLGLDESEHGISVYPEFTAGSNRREGPAVSTDGSGGFVEDDD